LPLGLSRARGSGAGGMKLIDFNTLNRGGHFAAWELHGGSVRRLSFVATTDLNKGAVAAALFEMT
jgi:hypothetical protein